MEQTDRRTDEQKGGKNGHDVISHPRKRGGRKRLQAGMDGEERLTRSSVRRKGSSSISSCTTNTVSLRSPFDAVIKPLCSPFLGWEEEKDFAFMGVAWLFGWMAGFQCTVLAFRLPSRK